MNPCQVIPVLGGFYPGASVALDFTANRYRTPAGGAGSVATIPGVTVTRASTGYAQTNEGNLVSFASGVARQTNRGLLVEEARTNLLLQSQTFDNASWTKTSATVTADQTAAPDGTTTADKLVVNNAVSFGRAQQVVTLSAATAYRLSIFAKAGEWSRVAFRVAEDAAQFVFFNISTGAVETAQAAWTTPTIEALGNGWYRCSATYTTVGTSYTIRIAPSNADGSFSTGDGTSGIFIWGAQLEAASTASSYIASTTASVTRAADLITIAQGMTAPFSAVTEFQPNIVGTDQRIFAVSDGTSDNWLLMWLNSGTPTASVRAGGSAQASIGIGSAVTAGAVVKLAARCATNDVQAARDGTLGSPDTVATAPTGLTTLSIGAASSAGYANGYVRRAIVYPRTLSDNELQTATR